MIFNQTPPLVSIIIPNYNNGNYLPECLDSIFKQTYENIEIICIDDMSSDNSIRILTEYQTKNQNMQLILNDSNMGVGHNRHKAIMLSSGKYFTTLDSDDFYLDNKKIEKEVEILERKNISSDVPVITFSDIRLVNAKGTELSPDRESDIKEGYIFESIYLRKGMIPRDFMLTKRQYIDAGAFDQNIPIYEDWDLKIRLAHNNEFLYTGISGIAYRRHGNGLSATNNKNHVKWLKFIYKKNSHLILEENKVFFHKYFDAYLKRTFKLGFLQRVVQSLGNFIRARK